MNGGRWLVQSGVVALMAAVGLPSARAVNPIVQTLYTTDPAPMVWRDTVYVYTGHDEEGARNYVMKDWRCYSSTDMVNWTDHGVVLSLKDFSWVKSDAWAGQCIEREGKFYYYVPVTQKSGGGSIGVAVSESPTGPFRDALGKPLVKTGLGDIDPTVFIDRDGQAYLYWGNPHLFYVKLNKDMVSFDTSIGWKGVVEVPLTHEGFGVGNGRSWIPRATLYEEGPWFYRRGDLYYMLFSAGGLPENICYATSAGAEGPWRFRGVIMPTEGKSSTNHCGVIDYKGHSYFFYHNDGLPGGGSFARSVCVEEFKYNADGTIPTIRMTKEGPAAVGHVDPYERVEAETMAWESGVKTKGGAAGSGEEGVYVTDIHPGAYIRVCSVDFGEGASGFVASVASGGEGHAIELRLDEPGGTLIGTLQVKGTGGVDKWERQSCSVRNVKGVHDLFFVFKGGDGMNFDWWKFRK
ncbi:MAG: glycoside hydrolase family 43 protein [Phycisphaerae bacterium]